MIDLPEEFVSRMRARLGDEAEDFLASYNLPPYRGVRVNTLKLNASEFSSLGLFEMQPVPWESNGFYVRDEKPGKNVFHAAGLYYVQEPSAMCAAPLLEVRGGERVLDLCSAPGGKGTQMAQAMRGEGIIVLNEINFPRAKILSRNVERLGITNAVVTCAEPDKLAQIFEGYFDKILVDAPCSGEGMFRKQPEAVQEWSMQSVRACAERQSKILQSAAKMLAKDGSMVYSTCTFSEEEDEWQVRSFLSAHPEFSLVEERRIYPHRDMGEGHYAALMKKSGGERRDIRPLKPCADKKAIAAMHEFFKKHIRFTPKNVRAVGSTLYSLPDGMPDIPVQTLRAGVCLGEVIAGRFEPDHALAMCLSPQNADCVEVDYNTALKYLSGETFQCDESFSGWKAVTHRGFPLGWCKCVNGVAKNHLPKGIRI